MWVAGEVLLGGCHRNKNLVVQREWKRSVSRDRYTQPGQVSPGNSCWPGGRMEQSETESIPCLFHRLSQHEQDR